jgi:hypothetical protein
MSTSAPLGDRPSATLGGRGRRPSGAEAIIIRESAGPRAQPRGGHLEPPFTLRPCEQRLTPGPSPVGEGGRAVVAD